MTAVIDTAPLDRARVRKDRRMLKAIAVGGAGLALLVGGGTFALWHDSDSISGESINSGELHFELGAGTWSGPGGAISDISTFLISPGDTVTLTQNVTITALGDHMQAMFRLDPSQMTGDDALKAALSPTMSIAALPSGMTANGLNTYNVAGTLTATEVVVSVTVVFPADSVTGTTAQAQTVNLASINFELEQV